MSDDEYWKEEYAAQKKLIRRLTNENKKLVQQNRVLKSKLFDARQAKRGAQKRRDKWRDKFLSLTTEVDNNE